MFSSHASNFKPDNEDSETGLREADVAGVYNSKLARGKLHSTLSISSNKPQIPGLTLASLQTVQETVLRVPFHDLFV